MNGRVAIITGGANGIGRATAQAFARAGAAVAIWDRHQEAGTVLAETITAAGGQALFQRVDVADAAAVDAAVAALLERWGRIDVLINNAGIIRDAQLVKVKDGQIVARLSDADFDTVIAVNLKGVFTCARAVAPQMIARRWGRIINAASVVGLYGNFGQTNYVAAKAGVIGMTRVWARELGRYGITVNAVAPGFIATDMTQSMPPKVLEAMIARTPVGRAGQPEDVAAAYLFLASEQAGFINGAVLSVDGGLVIGT
ncbi:3-oxoacyl-ACP reductase FabG [Kallotenue papyrolyticum]|uniref:3-oxoacyl-ACP reductase FabG n=1 Tax=Kallotenue papyrolyticum TaxID=1325125 RepID=UPI00047177EA|nr:3-oxoacyl-ACP reductase FabG [Kallotenue papyrolyticum]